MQIFKLFGSILVDSDKADKSISKTGKQAEGLSTKLGKGIATAAKFGTALSAGAAVAGGAIFALGVKLGDTADELLDLNSITGMTTDSIQKWRKAAEVAGVETNAMTNASTKLTKALDTMSVEGHKGQEALEAMGLSLSEIENMSADERMNTLTEALAGVDDKTERATLGADLFGGTWKEIAPIVDLGTEAMNKAKDAANIIGEEDLKKANDFRIKVADMKEQISFFVTEIGIGLMPMLTTMADWVQDKMPVIKSTTKTAFDVAGTAITNVSNFVEENIIPIFTSLFDLIMENKDKIEVVLSGALDVLNKAFEGVKKVVKLVIDNMNILLPIITGVTAAVLAQMVINGLVTAYKTWQMVTKTQTTLQWLLNAALNANPLGLVAIAIGAVIAAGVLLWKNWDTVKVKLGEFWDTIKEVFGKVEEFVTGVFGAISGAIEKAVDWLTFWNNSDVEDKNATVNTNYTSSGGGGSITGGIPKYASGTDFHPGGMALVGEEGPELVNLPKGSSVKTAEETESMLNKEIKITIENLAVRSDNDIEQIARKLKQLIDAEGRGMGLA